MEYQPLDEASYARRFRELIAGTESLHTHAQDVGDNRATIGWGYTFNRNDNEAIWRRSGIDLTDAEWESLRAIDQATAGQRTALGLAFPRQLNESEADQLLIASSPEYQRHADALGMPDSRERLALVSVTYNRGVGAVAGHPLLDAIGQDDRAQAWYQLRYNCWGSNATYEAGLRKRRLAEAQIFGLYNDPAQVTADEARGVFAMVGQHRDEIDAVERRYGETLDGQAGQRDLVALSNRDYPGITAAFGEVPTIREALEPARLALLAQLRADHPAHAHALADDLIDVGDIHVDPGPGRRIAGALDGGHGNDLYLLQDGASMRDADGQGMVIWNGRILSGPADAGLQYELRDGTLSVSDERGRSIRIEDYNGGLGIDLPPARTGTDHADAATRTPDAMAGWQASLPPQLAPQLLAAGHDEPMQQRIAQAWGAHLQRHAHLGPADQVLLSRDGQTLAGLHGAVMSEMHIPNGLLAQNDTTPMQAPGIHMPAPERRIA